MGMGDPLAPRKNPPLIKFTGPKYPVLTEQLQLKF